MPCFFDSGSSLYPSVLIFSAASTLERPVTDSISRTGTIVLHVQPVTVYHTSCFRTFYMRVLSFGGQYCVHCISCLGWIIYCCDKIRNSIRKRFPKIYRPRGSIVCKREENACGEKCSLFLWIDSTGPSFFLSIFALLSYPYEVLFLVIPERSWSHESVPKVKPQKICSIMERGRLAVVPGMQNTAI